VDATYVNLGMTINEMTDKMAETMKERITRYSNYLNHNRDDYNQSDPSLESPKSKVSLFDNFESSCLARPELHSDISFPSLEQESDHSVSLSPNLEPEFTSPRDVT